MEYPDVIFDLLDKWRHFPSYQLERRADIFFAAFLPDLIEDKYQSIQRTIIPEFPIRIGTIRPENPINKSYKADYFILTEDPKYCVLIELKTDDTSRRDEQDDYLAAAQKVKLSALIDGVISIYHATEYKHKYDVLINELTSAGILKRDGKDISNLVEDDLDIEVIYIQPNPDPGLENSISFEYFSDLVAVHADEFAQRFSKSLKEWAAVLPGHK